MKKFLVITFIITAFSFWTTSVFAVGVAVKPKEFDLKVQTGKEFSQDILVANIDEVRAIYKVYVDDFSEVIVLEPSEFTLEAKSNQIVTLKIKTKSPGILKTSISVVARPYGAGGLPTSTGVKVPVEVVSEGIPVWYRLLALGLLLLVCLAVPSVVKSKNKKDIFNIHKTNLKK